MAKHASTTRTRTPVAGARAASTEFPSPAAGVSTLRRRIEARGGFRGKRARAVLAAALSRLEADYERMLRTTGSYPTPPWSASSPRQARRSARLTTERPQSSSTQGTQTPRQDVGFVPTPPALVNAMLRVAKITRDDIVYDLGCGDGRIVIAAATQCGARGVGIDIDPRRIEEAIEGAAREGVADRVRFLQADLFDTDVREATVVMLYLLPCLNLELRGRLLAQLEPGSRIVSHAYDMGDWPPAQSLAVNGHQVHRWTVPAHGL